MMRRLFATVVVLLIAICAAPPIVFAQTPATTQAAVRFQVVDIIIDSGDRSLAAWQVELTATSGDVKIVGIEGGARKDLYRDPPYYDPAALAGGRIILASYTTDENPPKGKVHVARVHLQTRGEFTLATKVMAAADAAGQAIPSTASIADAPTTRPNEKE